MAIEDQYENRKELAAAFGREGFKSGAEIGVWMGRYSETLCKAMPGLKLLCVDTWEPSRNHRDPVKVRIAYKRCKRCLAPYDATLIKKPSLEAAPGVLNGSLDFVYIDALHDFKNCYADICVWAAKVRVGGVVAGHDWGHKGVTAAVNTYNQYHNIGKIFSTIPCEEDWYPSWYWVKIHE